MVLRPSVLPSVINYLPSGYCVLLYCGYCWQCELLVAWDSATLRQSAPSPVLRLLRLGTPLPNLPVRAPAADAFTRGTAH